MLLLLFWVFIVTFSGFSGADGGRDKLFSGHELPSWLKDNPAFENLIEINSLDSGAGEITSNASDSLGWVVKLNNEAGYGVDIALKELVLDGAADNYLMLAGWPISDKKFKQIKILTGKYEENKNFRILNAKQFVVLFHSANSNISPALGLNYTRHGHAYKKKMPPPDDPVKKETLYEVYLKGRSAFNFSDPQFLLELKEAIRKEAEAYCLATETPFNSSITTQDMVFFRKISFCPFDWPDRDICVALQHSVFVSGDRIPDEDIIINYELTADKLKEMWMQSELPEIEKLGIYVFRLSESSSFAIWWILVTLVAVVSPLIMIFVFWKTVSMSRKTENSSLDSNSFKDEVIGKKPRYKMSKHQQIPPFMFTEDLEKTIAQEELTSEPNSENLLSGKSSAETSSEVPIKNYFGSFMFATNKGFEDDENLETHSTI